MWFKMGLLTLRCGKALFQHSFLGSKRATLPSFLQNLKYSTSSTEIRQIFMDYFLQRGHKYIPPSSVIPHNRPPLLFVNAGSNQFDPIFQGTIDPRSDFAKLTRATNSQKCIQAGSMHNDLYRVGTDTYHHTFFEMLGNWSFGDFFKKEAIEMAWDLLVNVYKVPKERLYVTYFGGDEKQNLEPDEDCKQIWLDIGVSPERVLPFGTKDNFWEKNKFRPCGPCTNIHYDRIGGREVPHLVNMDDPDVLELWNLVFMQFNREISGELQLLPKHHVSTGMGLERIASVVQGKRSNYDTDLFEPYFDIIHKATGVRPYSGKFGDEDVDGIDMAYRIVADHIRALTVAFTDRGRPHHRRRGKIIQRILRRGVLFCSEKLGASPGVFADLVHTVVATLGDAFPELKKDPQMVIDVINEQEKLFLKSFASGKKIFTKNIQKLGPDATVIPGDVIWFLYQSYGIPLALIQLMAEERSLSLDTAGFKASKRATQILSRGSGKEVDDTVNLNVHAISNLQKKGLPPTEDKPKYSYTSTKSGSYKFDTCEGTVVALQCNMDFVDEIASGTLAVVILDRTCFHAEQGGQIYDEGSITKIDDEETEFLVRDVQVRGGYVLHVGTIEGRLRVGDKVLCTIDEDRRTSVMKNHTGAHILNFALRKVLGEADQIRSLITPDKLCCEFIAKGALTNNQLRAIEEIAHHIIEANYPIYAGEAPLPLAKEVQGLRVCFDEVYPDPVRVLSVGVPVNSILKDPIGPGAIENSVELCGGTHLQHSGHIQSFAVVSEEPVGIGVRKIVALTGAEAKKSQRIAVKLEHLVETLRSDVKAGLETYDGVIAKITKMNDKLSSAEISKWRKNAMCNALKSVGIIVEVMEVKAKSKEEALAAALIELRKLSPNTAAMLLSVDNENNKIVAYCLVPNSLIEKGLTASKWMKTVSPVISGSGWGRKDVAMTSGPGTDKLAEAVKVAKEFALSKTQ